MVLLFLPDFYIVHSGSSGLWVDTWIVQNKTRELTKMDYMPPQPQPGQSGPYQQPGTYNQTDPYQQAGQYQQETPSWQSQPQSQQQWQQQPSPVYVMQQAPNAYAAYGVDPYKGKATAGLVLGIIGLTVWLIPFVGAFSSIVCSIIGIVLSAQGRRSPTGATMATAGLILSIIALVMVPILLICTLGLVLFI
jgi:hypothetical protein